MSNLIQRTLTGIIFVALIIGAILLDHLAFAALFLVVTIFSQWEFYGLVASSEIKPQKIMGIITGIVLFVLHACISHKILVPHYLMALMPFLFGIFIAELYRKHLNPFANIAFTTLGVLYIALPFSLLNFFAFNGGSSTTYVPWLLLGYFLILWINDTMAYVSGMLFGKHRLAERISPKKSWEGSIGGGLFSIALACLLSLYFKNITTTDWVVIACIIVVTGTFGDLVESMLKRSMNIKDSGHILPGHGGLLDRFDGLLLSVPFVCSYLYFFSCK